MPVVLHAATGCVVNGLDARRSAQAAKELDMDIAMVVLTVAFFALSFAYVRACDAL